MNTLTAAVLYAALRTNFLTCVGSICSGVAMSLVNLAFVCLSTGAVKWTNTQILERKISE